MEWKGASKVAKVPPKQRKQASLCWVFPLVLVLGSLSQKQEAPQVLLSSAIRELLACHLSQEKKLFVVCFICVSHLDQVWGALRFESMGLERKAGLCDGKNRTKST
jgi:hypothetical protein